MKIITDRPMTRYNYIDTNFCEAFERIDELEHCFQLELLPGNTKFEPYTNTPLHQHKQRQYLKM